MWFFHYKCIIQERAVSAVISFTKDLTSDILTPYMDGIVTKLLALLQVKIIRCAIFLTIQKTL